MSKKSILATGALLLSVVSASATSFSTIGVGVVGGTMGAGVEVGTNVSEKINLRATITGVSVDRSLSDTDIDYDASLKLFGFGVLADYRPFNTNFFRLSGGIYYNGNKFELDGKPSADGSFTINNQTYSLADVGSAKASVKYEKIAPYIGIGGGNIVSQSNWSFNWDLGVMFTGSPSTTLNIENPFGIVSEADIQAEKKKVDDEIGGFDVWPLLQIGVSYRF